MTNRRKVNVGSLLAVGAKLIKASLIVCTSEAVIKATLYVRINITYGDVPLF